MLRQPIVTTLGNVDAGKCVHSDTLVCLSSGSLERAESIYEKYEPNGKKTTIEDGWAVELKEGPTLLSFDGEKIVAAKASHIWKRRANSLVRVSLSNGDVISTTPEHPFMVFKDFNLSYKRADELGAGEVVLGPAGLPIESEENWKTEILERMARSGNFVVFMDEKSAQPFFEALKKAGERKLSRNGLLSTSLHKNRFRITDFVRLAKHFGFPLSTAYDWIVSFKNSSSKRRAGHTSLPLRLPNQNSLEQLGYFLGAWVGDGSKGVTFHNNDTEVQQAYQKALLEVFGAESKVVWGHTCWMVVARAGATLSRLLSDVFGLPEKDKSSSVNLPWICQTRKDCFKGFVEGWFDTDGYASPAPHNLVEFTSKSEKLVRQVAIRLAALDIQAKVYSKNGYFFLKVVNREFLGTFLECFAPKLSRRLQIARQSLQNSSTSRLYDGFPLGDETKKEIKKAVHAKAIAHFASISYAKKQTFSRDALAHFAKHVRSPNEVSVAMQQFLQKHLRGIKVTAVEPCENEHEWVYDFTIPNFHNFVAERVIVHNTSILDAIRHTKVASREFGGITQHVGASEMPLEVIDSICGEFLEKNRIKLSIPGLLFIDTPGHAVFANLRRRGGSIADIAILVVDVSKGIEEQTKEAIGILREYKAPFVIALNKVDMLTGWIPQQGKSMSESMQLQRQDVLARLDERVYAIIGELYALGLSAERYDRVSDFTKQILMIPVSAKTREGLQELLAYISGLAQRYLEKNLKVEEGGQGKASILEVREEQGLGMTFDAILYQGSASEGQTVVFATVDGFAKSKLKAIFKPKPLDEMRDPREKFSPVQTVHAACGIKVSCENAGSALPGGQLYACRNEEEERQAIEAIESERKEIIFESSADGVMLFADALGSLEAITKLLSSASIPVRAASVGKPTRKAVLQAASVLEKNRFLGVVLCFNVSPEQDVARLAQENGVKIFEEKIIYNLTEGYSRWVEEQKAAEKREAFASLVLPAKIRVMKGHVFRISKPCIVGVEVLAGTLKSGVTLLDEHGVKIGELKAIQQDKESVQQAGKGKEVAVSIDGPVFGRQLREEMVLYAEVPRDDAALLEGKYRPALSEEDLELLRQSRKLRTA